MLYHTSDRSGVICRRDLFLLMHGDTVQQCKRIISHDKSLSEWCKSEKLGRRKYNTDLMTIDKQTMPNSASKV